MTLDSLIKLEEDGLKQLIDLLEADIPNSVHAYNYLKTALEWGKKKEDYNVLILSPFGDFSGATFVLHTRVLGCFCGTAYSNTEAGIKMLERALRETKRLDWSSGSWAFTCMEPHVGEMVARVAKEMSENDGRLVIHHNSVFYLPKSEAQSLQIGRKMVDGFKLVEMSKGNFESVNGTWAHRTPLLDSLVSDTLEMNGGWGLASEDGGQEPVSWALLTFYGGLGLVYTQPRHRGRGLASAAVLHTASTAPTPHLHLSVLEGNTTAEQFFTSLGFRPLPRHIWVYRNFFG